MTTTPTTDQSDLPVGGRRRSDPDWAFATTPKWVLSHLFALAMIVVFIVAMFWQLDRRTQRIAQNDVITERAESPTADLDLIATGTAAELDYRPVATVGEWLDSDLVRVANRSQNGVAGEWVVGLFESNDGVKILVNRGFAALNATVDEPVSGEVLVGGWLRQTVEREGLAVADSGEGRVVLRLNVEDITGRLGDGDVAPMWLQLSSPTPELYPQPVPLPELSNGPHLSYAGQWLTFALLGSLVYVLLLRRISTTVRD